MQKQLVSTIIALAVGVAFLLPGWSVGQALRRAPRTSSRIGEPASTQDHRNDLGPKEQSASISERIDSITRALPSSPFAEERAARLFDEFEYLQSADFPTLIATIDVSGGEHAWRLNQLLVGYWAERDLPAARDWLLTVQREKRTTLAWGVFGTWRAIDPAGMINWCASQPKELQDELAFAVPRWLQEAAGKIDPERALQVAEKAYPAHPEKWDGEIFRQWASTDPLAASERALGLPAGGRRSSAIAAIAGAWAQRDSAGARKWAEGLPDAQLSNRALVQVGVEVGRQDGVAGAEFLAGLMQSDDQKRALSSLLDGWRREHPDDADRWLANTTTIPEPEKAKIRASFAAARTGNNTIVVPPHVRSR